MSEREEGNKKNKLKENIIRFEKKARVKENTEIKKKEDKVN